VRAVHAASNLGPDTNTATAPPQAADTQPPTAPTNLQATASGTTQIGLTWTAATDNVGVTGYRVERCQGAGCSNFAQIATPASSPFTNTGLAPSTSYSYRVRAVDAASNLGPYSNTATATTQAAPTNLVAAYSFNEGSGTSVADASGNGNGGAIGTASWTTQGKFGNALSFNGTSAKVTVADSTSLRLTSGMTLEAWVNPSAVTSAWRDVIVKGDDDYYLMGTSSPSALPVGAGIFGGVKARAFGTSPLALNTWTYLATAYDGANLKLYVNGVLVATTPKSGTIQTSTNPLQFGGDSIYGQYFSGLIDEVRVYNGARTGVQIQSDMGTPLVLASRSFRAVQNSSPSPRAMTSNVVQRIARSIRKSVLAPAARADST
jgi:chitodextrinase